MELKNNPWHGLQYYLDSDEDRSMHPFCGRDKDSQELYYIIDNNLFTTLYGRSGIGKTSLLNAGVFPLLRDADYVPIYVRLATERKSKGGSEETFSQTIVRRISEAMSGFIGSENMESGSSSPGDVSYLWSFFAARRYTTQEGTVKYPVVVLDQLEEIFNSSSEDVRLLLLQLQELGSNRRLATGETLNINFRFVLSIREDDLFLLEDAIDTYYISELKQNRYRLKPLTADDAIRVIEIRGVNNLPLAKSLFEVSRFDEIAAVLIQASSTNDATKGVNTLMLSLVCNILYDKAYSLHSPITYDLAISITNTDVLSEFYISVVQILPKKQRRFIEDNLVDENGRRNSVSVERMANNASQYTRLMSGRNSILHEITDGDEHNRRVELVHDSLAMAIKNVREKRDEAHLQYVVNGSIILYYCVAGSVGYFFIWRILSIGSSIVEASDIVEKLPNIGIIIALSFALIFILLFFPIYMIRSYFNNNITIRKVTPFLLIIAVIMYVFCQILKESYYGN